MDLTIEYSKIALFVGANGVGKSFILKLCFAIGTVAVVTTKTKNNWVEAAQVIFDRTFSANDITGKVGLTFSSGDISIDLDNGKVILVEVGSKGLENPVPVTFMSSEMRTFDALNMYVKYRAQYKGKSDNEVIDAMSQAYPLYDVLYVENLIKKCPIEFTAQHKDWLTQFDFPEKIKEVYLEDGGFFFSTEDGKKRPVNTLGKGHQAMLNMFLGVS